MPLRYAPLRAALAACELSPRPATSKSPGQFRKFHASRVLRDDGTSQDSQNHYQALNISPHASPTEVKKSFYALSKEHHPDHNPSDPHAPRRFMRISEAYAVLGHADKRARYDRDVMRLHHQPAVPAHGGSYHSTGPAGGRPASGLSRRRTTTFRGPPPSFYRSGGWGAYGEKRRAAHEESTGTGNGAATGGAAGSAGADAGAGFTGMGGMGPGQNPFGHGRGVPHFDRAAHERSGRTIDARRAQRRAKEEVSFMPDVSALVGFLLISGVIFMGVAAPAFLSGEWMSNRRKDEKRGTPTG